MSTTVNEAFNKFNKEYVNLDPDRTEIARTSRDWLLTQLLNLPAKVTDFPTLYEGRHINFGSFARKTKIRELDDIDLILTFHADNTKYEVIQHGKEYILRPPQEATNLQKLCNEDGTLNSIKLVNKIVASLDKIDQYKASEKHRKQEAATLQLTTYEWNFDIVPSFYTDTEHYMIPDGDGGWKATDPRIDEVKVNRINQKHGGKILQIIRTLKFWNKRAMMTTIPSYLFENIILDYFNAQTKVGDYLDLEIENFWDYLSKAIHYDIPDPKNFQGNLNTLTSEERESISAKAKETFLKAEEAVMLELTEKNQPAAIRKWAEIFGPNFN